MLLVLEEKQSYGLDAEWQQLMEQAKSLGISIEEVKKFLSKGADEHGNSKA